tara:strand:+ start:68 stop:565 length:498 start_codon:yes stop_codon:yes gene_type:complete
MEVLIMSESLDRNQIIELLNNLSKEQDKDVLSAARSLNNRVTKSGLSWDDLLVADQSEVEEEGRGRQNGDSVDRLHNETNNDSNFPDDPIEQIEKSRRPEPSDFAGNSIDDTQTLPLIEKLLADDRFSPDLHEELEEYKIEIANGNFEPRDHQYVHHLYARLTKT